MSILITTGRISPVLGAVVSELKKTGITPTVHFQSEANFFGPEISSPPWLADDDSLLQSRMRESGDWETGPEMVIALGLESSAQAIEDFPRATIVTVMLSGDLDFSRRNRGKLANFALVNERSVGFVFIHEWEMTKAVSLGSTRPHFLWNPAIGLTGVAALDPSGEKIAVVYSGRSRSVEQLEDDPSVKRLQGTAEQLGKEIHFLDSNAFFWYSDFKLGRDFTNVVELRLQGFSDALFLDHDIDSIVTYLCLDSEPGRVLVKSSVASGLVGRNRPTIDVASLDTFPDRLLGNCERVSECPKSEVEVGRSLIDILDVLTEGPDLPEYFEDFGDIDSFAVFLTVAAVEDRSDGARPQRIRNMYLALSRSVPTLQINLDLQMLGRRTRLIESWVEQGIDCDVVYGENSTNPVRSVDAIVQTYRLVDHLAAANNTPSCWFVRDLHWLDGEIIADEAAAGLRRSGAFELERLSRSFGSLASPSTESAVLFNSLVEGSIDVEFPAFELPPAVTRENCVLLRGQEAGTTFLYTGGIGEAYKMDIYLDAVAQFLLKDIARPLLRFDDEENNGDWDSGSAAREVYFDFLVRPNEQSKLEHELGERNIAKHPAVRILNGSLDEYEPLTDDVVGILLLESSYARQALPYKSVSYASKGIRYLVYEGSPAQRVFGPRGVAVSVDQDRDAVVDILSVMHHHSHDADVDWAKMWEEENWDARIQSMRAIATVGRREA